MSHTSGPFSQLGAARYAAMGCGLLFCLSFQMSDEGIDAPGVPLYYPMGGDMGCVVFAVFVSPPHRIAWVRGLLCSRVML